MEFVKDVLPVVAEINSKFAVAALGLLVIAFLVWVARNQIPQYKAVGFIAVIGAVVAIVVAVSLGPDGDAEDAPDGDGEQVTESANPGVEPIPPIELPRPGDELEELFTIGSGLGPSLDRVVRQQSNPMPQVGDAILVSIVPDVIGTYEYSWDFSNCHAEVSRELPSEVEFVVTRRGPCRIILAAWHREPPEERREYPIVIDIAPN